MNAERLFLENGNPSHVWFCQKCKRVHQSVGEAEACCAPSIWESCGKAMDKPQYRHTCDSCQQVKFTAEKIAKEKARFEAAKKVSGNDTDYKGWVFCEQIEGHNVGFFESLQELLDFCQDESEPMPEYCWACNAIPFAVTDIEDILQNIEENGYDDFDGEDCKGIPELKAAINVFNQANSDILKYEPDYKLAILIPEEVRRLHQIVLEQS
jgi:hypothetical protein